MTDTRQNASRAAAQGTAPQGTAGQAVGQAVLQTALQGTASQAAPQATLQPETSAASQGTAGQVTPQAATQATPASRTAFSIATPAIGKLVRLAARVTHHGGSALPGRVIEQIDPGFLARTLAQLPLGVVLVSGTNGKTTTTRMVASMLSDLGLRVFTNPTGSNFTRGVASALLERVTLGGRLDADIAVLELDEAYAVHFVRQVRPRYALLLNVMRDQLDRFGEIDNTARLLGHVAAATTGTVILNREDPRIARLAELVREPGAEVRYFGLSDDLRSFFPSDDDMATTVAVESAAGTVGATDETEAAGGVAGSTDDMGSAGDANVVRSSVAPTRADDTATSSALPADVTLTRVGDHEADFLIAGETKPHTTTVKLEGVYNLYNAAAALAVVRAVREDARRFGFLEICAGSDGPHEQTPRERTFASLQSAISYNDDLFKRVYKVRTAELDDLLAAVSHVTPAFGRGEIIDVNGQPTELLLVKNPMGFRLSLASFPPSADTDTMIVINDEYADGRDMSWLWDVDFTSLRETGVKQVSGVRAWDMALRLGYDQVPVGAVNTDIDAALAAFVRPDPARPGKRNHIYCTYTAMLAVRAALARVADVPDAGVGK